jgi:tetraacyldisaccharide 4'-kinase
MLYGVIGWLRGIGYGIGLLPSYRAAVPVVSVGNLVAGGTGKTPVVDWLIKEFARQSKKVAVISRGYGGSFAGEVGVVSRGQGAEMSAAEAGDEPVLLAQRNPDAIVLIAKKRSAGVKLAVEQYGAEVVVLDDGFQHRAVARDLDLILLDAQKPYGNFLPLPAGLLREFPTALARADLLLLTRAEDRAGFDFAKPVYRSRHQLAEDLYSLDGQSLGFDKLKTQKVFAFAGIANPDSFFSGLEAKGLELAGRLAFDDHCKYDTQVLETIKLASAGCDALLTTEKDAVKLKGEFFTVPCYQAPMNIVFENEAEFKDAIQKRLWG